MDFVIKNVKDGISEVARKLGYVIIDSKGNGEYNLVRKLQFGNFPRFHVYLTQQGDNFNFSLHLDQKAPIYKPQNNVNSVDSQYDWRRGQDTMGGVHAHNGEYFGPVVETEGDRIKEILK